ncbi:adenylyltransferase/cytidyltransferase family protein [Paenibacillus sinopodophylli]|uniref:adenylyltransferase/cytidyltransferase family protein n=1 Tax=Paenibacillus sinopodophylli TaxID=1837342 RepID=UPI001486D1D2|nr:adenylyltransferase/cytidyltransferase family protein [Paenibacillus sinopodophylli]
MKKIVFAGSFDPAHKGHLNTYLLAKEKYNQEITICINRSPLKKSSRFSVEERFLIAQSIFKTNKILVLIDVSDMINLIKESDIIIQGYHEISEIDRLRQYYKQFDCEELFDKNDFLKIQDDFADVTSTNIVSNFFNNEQFARDNLSPLGFEILKGKLMSEAL